MSDVQVLYGESLAATTANSTTWVDVASIPAASFTANKKYLILANQVCVHDNSSNHTRVRLVHGTTPTEFDDAFCVWEGQGSGVSTQDHEISYMYLYTQPGTTELVKLQIAVNTTGSTVTNKLSQIIAINMDDIGVNNTDYFFTEDLTNYTITATPTAKATTNSFTPNGTDRWLFIGHMIHDVVTITDEIGFELYDSVAGVLGLTWQEAEDTADQRAENLFWAGVPSNASRTLSIRPVNEAGSNVMLRGACLVINLSKFAQSASAFDAAEVDPPNGGSSYTTVATIAPTPDATGDWVVIAFSTVDSDYQNEEVESRLQINAGGGGLVSDPDYGTTSPGADAWDSLDENPFNVFNLVSLTSGASRTINWDWRQVGVTTVIRVEDNGIVAFSVALAAGGQTVTVNQVTETDTAQAIGRIKQKAVAQIFETDTSQAISAQRVRAVAQVTETDTVFAITPRKLMAIGQVLETDTAQVITPTGNETIVPVNQVTESDAAQAIATQKIKAVAQAAETDTAQLITVGKVKAISQVAEIDLAQAIARQKSRTLGQALESDLAQAVSRIKIKSLSQTSETDTAQAITSVSGILVQQVEETDIAQALFPLKRVAVAQAVEIELSQPISAKKVRAIGQVFEIDLAQAITFGTMVEVILGLAYLSDNLIDTASLADVSRELAGLNDRAFESAVLQDDPL